MRTRGGICMCSHVDNWTDTKFTQKCSVCVCVCLCGVRRGRGREVSTPGTSLHTFLGRTEGVSWVNFTEIEGEVKE